LAAKAVCIQRHGSCQPYEIGNEGSTLRNLPCIYM
jgi:hypothetical protein